MSFVQRPFFLHVEGLFFFFSLVFFVELIQYCCIIPVAIGALMKSKVKWGDRFSFAVITEDLRFLSSKLLRDFVEHEALVDFSVPIVHDLLVHEALRA